MEVVEGETLAGRIPMALGDALPLFIQLAEGMEAAHEKGIVHRDLKPSNAMITQEGQIRILDSGLAKAFTPDESVSAASAQSPTLTKGTAFGTIMGTASYMSLEQARGKPTDKRTDIWAFRCCLFEEGADMWMLKIEDRLDFALEAWLALGALSKMVGEDIDGHRPIEPGVFGLVDLAYPALSDWRKDLVGT